MLSGLSLRVRLCLLLVLIMVAASSLTGFLTLSKFRKVLEERALSTYSFQVMDLRSIVEDGINLGVELAVLRSNQPLLERRKAANSGTLGITIHGVDGRVLYDTDRFRIGGELPPAWRADGALPLARGGDATGAWWRRTSDGTAVGAPLVNSFGQTVGGIVLRFDPTLVDRGMTEVTLRTVQATILWAGGGSLLAVLLVLLATGPLFARFRSMADALQDLAQGPAAPRDDEMEPFRRAAADVAGRLSRADHLIERIGLAKRGAAQAAVTGSGGTSPATPGAP